MASRLPSWSSLQHLPERSLGVHHRHNKVRTKIHRCLELLALRMNAAVFETLLALSQTSWARMLLEHSLRPPPPPASLISPRIFFIRVPTTHPISASEINWIAIVIRIVYWNRASVAHGWTLSDWIKALSFYSTVAVGACDVTEKRALCGKMRITIASERESGSTC
jgi:hypothetical protein